MNLQPRIDNVLHVRGLSAETAVSHEYEHRVRVRTGFSKMLLLGHLRCGERLSSENGDRSRGQGNYSARQ
jgi:hypothetical protein